MNDNVWIADRWVTSYAAKEPYSGVFKTAENLMKRISDEKYSQLCNGIVFLNNSVTALIRPSRVNPNLYTTKYNYCCSVNPVNSDRVKIRQVSNLTFTGQLWFRGIDFLSFMKHMSLAHNN